MEDLTGFWNFSEVFDFGKKSGEARLFQQGTQIGGNLIFKETSDDGCFLMVRCQISGHFDGSVLVFSDLSHSVLLGGDNDAYLPEAREGRLNANGQIVGTVTDADDVNGIFVMERHPFKV